MRILGINFPDKNNTSVKFKSIASMDNIKLHNNLERSPKRDEISFTSKIPSIVTPTLEDIVNRTKAVDVLRYNVLRLAKYNVPCPVCGHIMLPVDKYDDFEAKVMRTTNPREILGYINELKKYLHPVEAKIYKIMIEDFALNSSNSLVDTLRVRLPRAEQRIIQTQSAIFANIGLLSRKLPDNERTQVQELLKETFARILDPRETSRFSRHVFLDKLKYSLIPKAELDELQQSFEKEFEKNFTSSGSPSLTNYEHYMKLYVLSRLKDNVNKRMWNEVQEKIIEEAIKLPMAFNNMDAFIVKYAKRDYKNANPDQKIALRMLSNSLATVEHIKAQSKHGDTEPGNLALLCACDNNRRGADPIFDQVIENPMMIHYYPRYMRRLCEIHRMGKVEKSYITQQNKTYSKESLGWLSADLSALRYDKKQFGGQKRNKAITSGTPTKAERRAGKKLKMKAKKHHKSKNL